MREIRFRAFLKKLNKIVDVVSIHWHYKQIMWFDGNVYIVEPFDEVILLEDTNLKDKNNFPIYEGDVLKTHGQANSFVEYVSGSFCGFEINGWDVMTSIYPLMGNIDKSEIIGNIHMNPNLLSQED